MFCVIDYGRVVYVHHHRDNRKQPTYWGFSYCCFSSNDYYYFFQTFLGASYLVTFKIKIFLKKMVLGICISFES